jgi:hypothetical protein
VAKKTQKEIDRRAAVEKMRQDQARQERRRSMLILGGCVVVVLGLLAAALVPYLKDKREQDRIAGTPIEKIGVTAKSAGCNAVETKTPTGAEASGARPDGKGEGGNHVATGLPIKYKQAPPAFGQHWPNYLGPTELRAFYTPEDRPQVERLVHSLEHGHTLIWYDDTIAAGTKAYKDLQAIADKYSARTPYVNIAPWTAADGGEFPSGTHVALTHWTMDGDDQKGVWQYCGKPSGEVIKSFVKDYPSTNAPEPGGT